MTDEMQSTLTITFLKGATFCNLMKDSLNSQDYELLLTCISSDQQIKTLADAIIVKGGNVFRSKGSF